MYGFYLKKASFFVVVLVGLFVRSLPAQTNQEIYYKYCVARPHPNCFNPVPGAVDSVGRDVFELGGGYRFCLKIDTVDAGFAPIRVVIVLDKSYSMCQNPRMGVCCDSGDGTDNCMMNDPTDQRVVGAQAFVDSLAAKSRNSEVGVVTYETAALVHNPLPLNTPENIQQVKTWIYEASCVATGYNTPVTTTRRDTTDSSTTPAPGGGLGKTSSIKSTYLGVGLQSGMEVVDYDFSNLPADIKRHIILLTDGAWDDMAQRSPDMLVGSYTTQNPGRALPVIHGVFLSNQELHIAHGYPPEGCSNDDSVYLGNLQHATTLGSQKGLYFDGSTPQTVVANFDSLLKKMTDIIPQELVFMTVTNTTNGQVRQQKTVTPLENVTDTVNFEATIDNLPLEFGLNTLTVQWVVNKRGNDILDTMTTTVSIVRAENWTTQVDPKEYAIYCVNDSTTVSIRVTPPAAPVNTPFAVDATITMKNKLILDTVQLRAFTQFPDDAPNTVALFHLERNLDNAVRVGDRGTASLPVDYSNTDSLFGQSVMKQGSFTTGIGGITGDFALEAWINPSNTGTQTDLFSCSGLTLGIGADRLLYLTVGGTQTVKSRVAVDANTWSHVAVSRASGTVRIYINAVDVSDPVQFAGALQGVVTIACPTGGLLDEVRISSAGRMRTDSNLPRLDIPSLQNPTWTINGQSVTQPIAVVSPDMWKNGNILFQISSPIPGQVVVNFQHLGPVESRWSKNGNSVYAIGDLQPVVSIKVTPDTVLVNNPFNVQATVILKPWIILDTVQVRVFTQFPDNDVNTKAVFHLEGNLSSTTGGTGTASGLVGFTETNAAFGTSVMNQGSFETSIGNITGDFAFEAWINPLITGAQTDIFSGPEFSFGIGADRLLYFTVAGAQPVTASVPVDANAWSHVAISRASGMVRVYVNGVDVTPPIEFGSALLGIITVSCPGGGLLDEVRISDSNRMRPEPNFNRLDIPSLQQPTWTIANTTLTQPVLMIPPGLWSDENIQFQFSSTVSGKLVVNFQHKGSLLSQWSKNGNPVFAAGDLQGPFVKKATFINGLIGEIYDTLFVEFSEPVLCDSLKKITAPIASFRVYDSVADTLKPRVFEEAFYLDADACPEAYITKVTIVTIASVDGIVPKRDQLLLVGSAVDTAGNYPDTTRRKMIEWGPGRGIIIMPHEGEAGAPMTVPRGIVNRVGLDRNKTNQGKAIIIQTRGPLVPVLVEREGKPPAMSYGRTVIFDAVANVVAVNLPILQFPNNNRMYYVIWDGTNRQKRRVSSGAYLFRASVQYENEDPSQQPPPLMAKFSIKWSSGF
ncbi:MAG: hypothetical protein JW913_19245 [Chitinispirillaceae bacterium]|nr:hypothetical protein [Chitinispirillaceae bacterium]